jgi:hypothetical protein
VDLPLEDYPPAVSAASLFAYFRVVARDAYDNEAGFDPTVKTEVTLSVSECSLNE